VPFATRLFSVLTFRSPAVAGHLGRFPSRTKMYLDLVY
jgi:hypothetical protein